MILLHVARCLNELHAYCMCLLHVAWLQMSEKRSKKDSRDNTMLPPSKWKRRLMQLRFQTSSGPLVLELYKDDKRQQVCDILSRHRIPLSP